MNEFEQVETYEKDPIMESLLTTETLLKNDLNYQVTDIDMRNYCLHENTQPILVFSKKEFEVWTIYFDGARCKHNCSAGIFLGHLRDT